MRLLRIITHKSLLWLTLIVVWIFVFFPVLKTSFSIRAQSGCYELCRCCPDYSCRYGCYNQRAIPGQGCAATCYPAVECGSTYICPTPTGGGGGGGGTPPPPPPSPNHPPTCTINGPTTLTYNAQVYQDAAGARQAVPVVYHFFCKKREPGGILESDFKPNKEVPPWLTKAIIPYPRPC